MKPEAQVTGGTGFLTGQELVAYIFASVDGPSGEDAQAGIRHVWSQCRTGLGMNASIRQLEIPASLPSDFSVTPDPAVLAGQQSPDGCRQAMLHRSHDTLVLLLRFTATVGLEPGARPWAALDQLLLAAAGDLARHLPGAAVLYLATMASAGYPPEGQEAGAATPSLAALGALLPVLPGAGTWRYGGFGGKPDIWEIPAGDEADATRRLVMVAPAGGGTEISSLTWLSGGGSMPPLAHYLMHMAKIRYESRRLSVLRPAGPLCQRVADTVTSLQILTKSQAALMAGHGAGRQAIGRQLTGLRRDSAQMTSLLSALAAMRITVAISQLSAARALPPLLSGTDAPGRSVPDFRSNDQAIASSLIQRLNDDIAHLEESLDNARSTIDSAQAATGPSRRADPAVAPNGTIGSHPSRAVVLCALDVEHMAMRAHLVGLHGREHPAGTVFEVGHLPGTDWEVVLALPGVGNLGAAVIAERAINLFGPGVLLCMGVAGSLMPEVRLGDVVVATRVDAYHGGTAAEDFLARPRSWLAPHRLEQIAGYLGRSGEWQQRLPASEREPLPAVHFRPIASGEVVLDSRESSLFAQLRLHNNDAAAIEMEGAGIAQAAHFNDSLPALVIRGISDLADGSKLVTDQVGWQERASHRAAAFAAGLLASYVPQPQVKMSSS